jgi:hypothetical protein
MYLLSSSPHPWVPFGQREVALPIIKDCLLEFRKLGYAYKKNDLRWRHFGLREFDVGVEITLLDLRSMKEWKIDY